MKKLLLGIVGVAGTASAGDSSRATLNVEVVPSSEVLPERLVIVKKVLLSAEALSGATGNAEESRVTLNVEVVPFSEVCPEGLVIVKKVLLSAEALSGFVGAFTVNVPALVRVPPKVAFPLMSNEPPLLTSTFPLIGPSKPLHDT